MASGRVRTILGAAATVVTVMMSLYLIEPPWVAAGIAGAAVLIGFLVLLRGALGAERSAKARARDATRRARLSQEREEEAARIGAVAERRLQLLHSTHEAIATAKDLKDAGRGILRAICQTLGWSMGALWSLDPSEGHLVCLGTWHVPSNSYEEFARITEDWTFERGRGIPGRVWERGEPVWIPDVLEDDNFPRASFAGRADLRGAFAFPLRDGNRTVGVMEFFSPRIEEPQQGLVDILDSIGYQIGQYLERARAEEIQGFLSEVNEILMSSLDYRMTMSKIAESVAGYLADYCFIDAVDGPRAVRRLASAYPSQPNSAVVEGFENYPADRRSRHPALRVLRTGEPEVSSPVTEEALARMARAPEDAAALRGARLAAMASLPLKMHGRVIGAITLLTTQEGPRLDTRRLGLAEEVARRMSMALDNALVYEDRSRVARILQQSLIPATLPSITGIELAARYIPAGRRREVGGDFYDVFPYGKQRWGVVMGDVSGKGASAASLTALVRYTVRSEAMQQREPSGILAMVNEALTRQSSDEQFCTIVYGRIDPAEDGTVLTLVSAGHPLPFRLSGDGIVTTIGEPGSLLGIGPEVELREQLITLNAGDAVVFYTDGLVEARADGDPFGEERLSEVLHTCTGLNAEEIAERIDKSVREHAGEEAFDDIAFLIARVSD